MTLRRLLALDAALLSLMILASRAALLIHEGGGHALPALVLGARAVTMRLSPLGGGFVSAEYPPGKTRSNSGSMVFGLGGMALNLLTGSASWVASRRQKSRGLLYVALLFFGVGSVLGALSYLACGFYYNSGDPVAFAPQTEDLGRARWIWVLFLVPTALAATLGMRHYLEFLSGHVDLLTPRRRLGWMLATAGLAGLGYGGLWLAFRNPQIEGSTARWRLEREIEEEAARRAALLAAARPQGPPHPRGASDAAGPPSPPPRPAPIVVRPEEVADRVPPPVAPLLLYGTILGALFRAAWIGRPSSGEAQVSLRRSALLALAAALAVLGFRCWG